MDAYVQILSVLVINHAMHIQVVTCGTHFYKLNDGNEIPVLAYGTNLGHSHDGRRVLSVNRSMEIGIKWALAAGYRHFDTAAISGVENELGHALKDFVNGGGRRQDLYITTKLWNDAHEKDEVVPALKKSLAELQTDYVDLYLVHYPMAYKSDGSISYTDYLTTWKGMEAAKMMNLTRSIGVSNFNLTQMQRLWNNSQIKPSVLQIKVNPTITQEGLVNWCHDHGVLVTSHKPFGSILSRNKAAPLPRIDDPYLQLLALKYNKNVPQILIRYLLDRNISVVIPKSMHKKRIIQNIDVFDFELTDEEIKNLSQFNSNNTSKKTGKWSNHPHFPY